MPRSPRLRSSRAGAFRQPWMPRTRIWNQGDKATTTGERHGGGGLQGSRVARFPGNTFTTTILAHPCILMLSTKCWARLHYDVQGVAIPVVWFPGCDHDHPQSKMSPTSKRSIYRPFWEFDLKSFFATLLRSELRTNAIPRKLGVALGV